jgi:hypothetical protein
VKANPALAQQGEAATYGLMAHLPLRGMVKTRVLDIFAAMYGAGGADLDLATRADDKTPLPLVERIARWYVAGRQRRG